MNQFFYETRGKEKVKGLMEEGVRSQVLRQARGVRSGIRHNLPKIVLTILGILGLIGMFVR